MPRLADDGQIPVYDVPEAAAAALAHAARYGAWRDRRRTARCPASPTSGPPDARALVTGVPAPRARRRLAAARTRPPTCCTATEYWLVDAEPTGSEDEAVRAAAAVSGPGGAQAPRCRGLVPETDANAVELDLHTEAEVRAAYDRLADRFGRSASGSWCSR